MQNVIRSLDVLQDIRITKNVRCGLVVQQQPIFHIRIRVATSTASVRSGLRVEFGYGERTHILPLDIEE